MTRPLLLNMTANGSLRDPFVIQRGTGCHLYDEDGNRYVDGLSGLYCAQLGYGYADEFAEAAAAQLRQLPFSPLWSSSAHPAALELAERLTTLAPDGFGHVFFTGSGAESVETAWKLARKYHTLRGEPGRTKAIARRGAYHGLTLGALSFTDDPGLAEPFGDPAIETRFVANTNGLDAPTLLTEIETVILEEGPDTIAMLIAEPVQNRGGCLTPPEGYWPGLRALADRYGFLLVADEVITGFGRLGEWFGCTRYGVTPDLITVAKGLTAGYAPMGATLVGAAAGEVLNRPGEVLNHGFTFAGHPLCAAVALRALEIFERDKVLDNVRENENHLATRAAQLTASPLIADVRGAGFFYAFQLRGDRDDGGFSESLRQALIRDLIPRRLREGGLLARVYDRAAPLIQIAPPLVADRALLDQIIDLIQSTVDEASRKGSHTV